MLGVFIFILFESAIILYLSMPDTKIDVNELRNISTKAFNDFESNQAKEIEKQMNQIINICKYTADRGEYSATYRLEASYLMTQAIMTKLVALGLKVKLSVLDLTISWE